MNSHWISAVVSAVLLSIATCNPIKSNEAQDYDTIIVGLGAAGTVAASRLAQAGKKVLALEAQNRVGGRVYTVPFGDGVVEVGAEWLHGTENSITYHAAVDSNVTILPQDIQYKIVKSDGSETDRVIPEVLEYAYNFYEVKPEKAEPQGDYMFRKLSEYLEKKYPNLYEDKNVLKELETLLRQSIVNMWGAYDSNDLNACDHFVSIGGHQTASWHRNGYNTFFDIMLNKYNNGSGLQSLEFKLNTEVTEIQWLKDTEDKVLVTTKEGTIYKADNVIVTVSLGVLKEKHRALFSPPLPQKKITAIEKIQMGLIGKIIFSFEKAWWPSKDLFYGFIWKDEDVKNVAKEEKWITKVVEASSPMGSSNTLTLWTSGDVTKEVEIMPEDIVKSKSMAILRRFFPNATIPEPTGMIRSTWYTNEFTRGTYSYDGMVGIDVPTARADLAEPLKDSTGKLRVLFAGEASNPVGFATVHGAADTGHREAMRLLSKH